MFTVKDFLHLPSTSIHSVECGFNSISDKEIKYISVIEMPIDDFIRPGEIVLSTALGCHDHPEKLMSFVKEIYEAKASALVISIKADSYSLPQNVIDFGNYSNFPIIILPWEYRFAEIIEEVLEKRNENAVKKTKEYEKIQNELLFAYLNGSEINTAAKIISKFLNCKTIITDSYNTNKGNYNISISIGMLTEEYLSGIKLKLPIKSTGRNFGYIYFLPFKNTTIEDDELANIEHYFTMPLSLWFNKEDLINTTTMKLKDDFVWQIAKGSFDNYDTLKISASKLGFNLNCTYSCISGKLSKENFNPEETPYIENTIISIAKSLNMKILSTIRLENIIIFIENKGENTSKLINNFIDSIESKLKQEYKDGNFNWGISQTNKIDNNFNKLYKDSKFVLDMSMNDKISSNRIFFENAGIYRILTLLSDNQDILNFAKEVIRNLSDYDNSKNMDLINTLITYMNNNYNISKTSRNLHIHRQSLLYRLSKIEELSNISLNNHNDLFLLEICLRLVSEYV